MKLVRGLGLAGLGAAAGYLYAKSDGLIDGDAFRPFKFALAGALLIHVPGALWTISKLLGRWVAGGSPEG